MHAPADGRELQSQRQDAAYAGGSEVAELHTQSPGVRDLGEDILGRESHAPV